MKSPQFYLAWLKRNMDEFDRAPMRAKLELALVPATLGAFDGLQLFDLISEAGRPLEKVRASSDDLLSLRGPGTPESCEDSAERLIVESLMSKARRANHLLPEIITTRERPAWSRMVIPSREALRAMRQVAGL